MHATKDLSFKLSTIILGLLLIFSGQKLSSQEVSTIAEIYDFEVGEIFHLSTIGESSSGGDVSFEHNKILEKHYSINNDTLFYSIERKEKFASSPLFEWNYNIDTIAAEFTNLDDPLFSGDIDSVYSDPEQFNGRLINYTFIPGNFDQTYKYVNGCGGAYYRSYQSSGGYTSELEKSLVYFKKGEEEWGTPNVVVSSEEVLTSQNSIQIYPNPAKDFIQISVTGNQSFSYEISSINGQLVKQGKDETKRVVNISQLQAGLYIIKVEHNSKITYKKIIKE